MQRCAECGCRTPWGESMKHFYGCEHTSSHGKGQAQSLAEFLSSKTERAGLSRAEQERIFERYKHTPNTKSADPNLLVSSVDRKLSKYLVVKLH